MTSRSRRRARPAVSPPTRTLWFAKIDQGWQSTGVLVQLFEVPGGVVHVNPLNQRPFRVSPTLEHAVACYPGAHRSHGDAMAAVQEVSRG